MNVSMRKGVILNWYPEKHEIQNIDKMLPDDKKWHTIMSEPDYTIVDGKILKKMTLDRLT